MTTRSTIRSLNPIAALGAIFAARVPLLTRAGIAETLHDIGDKIADASKAPTIHAHIRLSTALSGYARDLAREALLRGYVTDEQTAPSKNGIQAEIDALGYDASYAGLTALVALLAKQVHLVGDAVALSTNGSDTGVTRASLAQYIRDLANTGREQDVGMYDIVDAANPVFDRAIEAEFITEGEVQGATVLFEDDREGGFKYLAYIADRIEQVNTTAAVV